MVYLCLLCISFNVLFVIACFFRKDSKEEFIHSIIRGKSLLLIFSLSMLTVGAVFLFHLYGYSGVKIFRQNVILFSLGSFAVKDYKEKIIPNKWLLWLLLVRMFVFIVQSFIYPALIWDDVKFMMFGALVCGGTLLLAYYISRHEIGLGDVKLFIVLGMYLGFSVAYLVLLLALVLAAIYGGINLLLHKLKAKQEIAFAPFVCIAAFLILGIGF